MYWKHHSHIHQAIAEGTCDYTLMKDTLEFGEVPPDYSTVENFTLLMATCCKGDKEMVSLLIHYKADLEAESTYNALASTEAASQLEFESGVTALVYAVLAEQYDCAKILIEAGAEDPGIISLNEEFSAYLFYYPLIRGDIRLAKLLVDNYGGNDGILNNGASQFAALINFYCAVRRHWMECARLKVFEDVEGVFRPYCNAATYYNSRLYFYKKFTPMSADEAKRLLDKLSASVDYFISLGIDLNRYERTPSGEAWTPLFYAVKYEDSQMAERLLVIGADANHRYYAPELLSSFAIGADSIHDPERPVQNLLRLAVKNNDKDTVKVLLKYGAMVVTRDQRGEVVSSDLGSPAFTSVLRLRNIGSQRDILRMLVEADPTGVGSLRTLKSRTSVMMSLIEGLGRAPYLEETVANFKINFKLLLQTHMDLNHTDSEGETALHKACRYGSHLAVSLLLRAGAPTNACATAKCPLNCNRDPGSYPLTLAFSASNREFIESILISFIQNGAELQISHVYNGQIKSTLEMLIYLIGLPFQGQRTLLNCARLLKIAGYDFSWDLNTVELLTRKESHFEAIKDLALEDAGNPNPLIIQCRRYTMKCIQRDYQKSVESLTLPTIIKEYLCFKELDNF